MPKCKYCGKEYRFVHSCFEMQPQTVKDSYETPFKEALEGGRQIVVIKDVVLSADGIGKHIETYSKVAEKYGYAYKSETHLPDSIGFSLTMIFERTSLKSEWECRYCKTINEGNFCSNCGSPRKAEK